MRSPRISATRNRLCEGLNRVIKSGYMLHSVVARSDPRFYVSLHERLNHQSTSKLSDAVCSSDKVFIWRSKFSSPFPKFSFPFPIIYPPNPITTPKSLPIDMLTQDISEPASRSITSSPTYRVVNLVVPIARHQAHELLRGVRRKAYSYPQSLAQGGPGHVPSI